MALVNAEEPGNERAFKKPSEAAKVLREIALLCPLPPSLASRALDLVRDIESLDQSSGKFVKVVRDGVVVDEIKAFSLNLGHAKSDIQGKVSATVKHGTGDATLDLMEKLEDWIVDHDLNLTALQYSALVRFVCLNHKAA